MYVNVHACMYVNVHVCMCGVQACVNLYICMYSCVCGVHSLLHVMRWSLLMTEEVSIHYLVLGHPEDQKKIDLETQFQSLYRHHEPT